MAEIISVMGTPVDDRVVLWEVNEAHPGGEVFIVADGRTYEVAATSAVLQRLANGRLVKVVIAPVSNEPVVGYDALTAAQVVELLPTLTDEQRSAVLVYETANRARATVLKALQ